jgi:hypothetical protein
MSEESVRRVNGASQIDIQSDPLAGRTRCTAGAPSRKQTPVNPSAEGTHVQTILSSVISIYRFLELLLRSFNIFEKER